MITPDQIKAARKLLGWSTATLAREIGRSAIRMARQGVPQDDHFDPVMMAVQATFEAAGVEFLNHGQPSVRLGKPA